MISIALGLDNNRELSSNLESSNSELCHWIRINHELMWNSRNWHSQRASYTTGCDTFESPPTARAVRFSSWEQTFLLSRWALKSHIMYKLCSIFMCTYVYMCVCFSVRKGWTVLLKMFILKRRDDQRLSTGLVSVYWNLANLSTTGTKEVFPSLCLSLKKLFDLRQGS